MTFAESFSGNSNQSNCKYEKADTALEKTAQRAIFSLLCSLGMIFNVLIIIVAMKISVRKHFHYLIMNMAIPDALYCFIRLFDAICSFARLGNWNIVPPGVAGLIYCKGMKLFLFTSYKVSNFTLLVISIERFRTTRRILRRSQPYTLKQRILILGACWLIAMPSSAYYAHLTLEPERNGHRICLYDFDDEFIVTRIVDYSLMLMVCIATIAVSCLTARRLSRPQTIHANLSYHLRRLRTRRSRAAARMVLASLLLYLAFMLPNFSYSVLLYLDKFGSLDLSSVCIDWPSLNLTMFYFLPVLHSVFSPIVYIVFLKEFQETFKSLGGFCCRRAKNNRQNRVSTIEMQEK